MPIYEYEHIEKPCSKGRIFERRQSIHDKPLTRCPACRGAVKKCLSLSNINTPKTNGELRDLGFTKLVRREKGVYENVTRRDGDNRYMLQDKPETIPNLKKTIRD
jgi:putative FmdB family regulatory protein